MENRVFSYRRDSRTTIHDFIDEAIRQVKEGGETVTTVAERLGLRPALMRQWLSARQPFGQRYSDDATIRNLKQENDALRKECRRLRQMILSISVRDTGSRQEQMQ